MQVKGISDLSLDELVQGVNENLSLDSEVYPTLSSDELVQVKGISDLSSDELVQGIIENLSSDSKVYPTLSLDELVQMKGISGLVLGRIGEYKIHPDSDSLN